MAKVIVFRNDDMTVLPGIVEDFVIGCPTETNRANMLAVQLLKINDSRYNSGGHYHGIVWEKTLLG